MSALKTHPGHQVPSIASAGARVTGRQHYIQTWTMPDGHHLVEVLVPTTRLPGYWKVPIPSRYDTELCPMYSVPQS
jgi:hypothetical protein